MDIVVEDGTGLPTANAYLTADEADDLLSINIFDTTWSGQTDDVKEALIMWATQLLEARVRWNGRKVDHSQGLSWPRCGARDKYDHWIDDNVVPPPVKLATAKLAYFILTNGADPESLDSSNNVKEIKVDVITLQFDPNILKNRYPDEIKFILDGLGWVSMGRGGPKRIVMH